MDAAVLVWGAVEDDPSLPVLTRRNIPVAVGEGPAIPGTALVGVEDQVGMRQAVQHLVDLGHQHIAEVTLALERHAEGDLGSFVTEDVVLNTTRAAASHRAAGFREVIQPAVTWEAAKSTVEAGRAAAHAILELDGANAPTAIVAQSDMLAAGVVLGVRDKGLVPGADISVVGFDGLSLPWLAPSVLTSVRQPLREKGESLAKAALELIARGEPTEVYLPTELVIGNTTAPPKAGVTDPEAFGWSW
jgi:DNA-binding LacI/PurR family transcriptional regulator